MDLPRLLRLGLGTGAFAGVSRVGSPDAVPAGDERVAGFLRFGAEHLADCTAAKASVGLRAD